MNRAAVLVACFAAFVTALDNSILMVALPAFAQPWTRRITGDDSIAIGHFGTAGYIAAGAVGRLVDRTGRSRSTAASLSTCVRRPPPDHSQYRSSAGPDRPRSRSRA